MREQNQKMRFNSSELSLLKGLFAGNDDLLFIIRKAMLQFELTESEKATIASMMNETTYTLLTKVFNPWLDPDAPFFQMTDMILGLGADIKPLSPDGAWPYIKAKELEIEFIAQQLKALNGGTDAPTVVLADLANLDVPKTQREQKYIDIMARNFILSFIDSNIHQVKVLAGMKEETVDQTLERLKNESTK